MTAICTAKAECAEEKSENNELVRLSDQINGEDTALLIRTDVFVQWAVAEALARAVEKRLNPAKRKLKSA